MATEKRKTSYKCVIWFRDGNVRTFYAPAGKRKHPELEKDRGYLRLVFLITIKFRGTWRSAVIYENGSEGKEMAAFFEGKKIR